VPGFVHIGYDRRALRKIAEGDVVVIAPASQLGPPTPPALLRDALFPVREAPIVLDEVRCFNHSLILAVHHRQTVDFIHTRLEEEVQ